MLFGFLKNSMWPENEKKVSSGFILEGDILVRFQRKMIRRDWLCQIQDAILRTLELKTVLNRLYTGAPVTSKTILMVNQLVPIRILTVLIVGDNHAQIYQKSQGSFLQFFKLLVHVDFYPWFAVYWKVHCKVEWGQKWSKVADYRK